MGFGEKGSLGMSFPRESFFWSVFFGGHSRFKGFGVEYFGNPATSSRVLTGISLVCVNMVSLCMCVLLG